MEAAGLGTGRTRGEPPGVLGGLEPADGSRPPTRSLPRPSRLARPLTSLPGIGPRLAELAKALGIADLADLLWHLPRDHRAPSSVTPIAELKLGEKATVLATVRSARIRPTRRPGFRILEANVADESGPMRALWFNQAWLAERLAPGRRVLLTGKLERSDFKVSGHELLAADAAEREGAGISTSGLVPLHPASERLKADRIRGWVARALPLAGDLIEPLPAALRTRLGFPRVDEAIRAMHFPRSQPDADLARRRLAFDELFVHQAALAARRAARRQARRGVALDAPGSRVADWLDSLPFSPTAGQRAAIDEIDRDLGSGRAMQRLLMGEVGSGKTVVALYVMLRALENGRQAALMAPTETLAEQHAATLAKLLADSDDRFDLLTGATPAAARREILARLAAGEPRLVVGTHALIEPDVEIPGLAVCVVDEQHRFGVNQRAALDAKLSREGTGEPEAPHVLHMTATPIPRTLSLTAFGDLDTTVLSELPAGRQPIRSWAVGENKRPGAYEFLRERLREGRQAFVVCALVSDSDKLNARAAESERERLAAGELRDFEVGLLHGQMSSARKAEAMAAFASGETDVLVATTVIEVGIDVPNATVMLIEDAERYGLSQLHQLRGRVGRGEHESYCILFANGDSELARRRMEAIASGRDGFWLAEVDLSLRGEGEVLGTRQSGLPRYRCAELPADGELLVEARRELMAAVESHEGGFDAAELAPLMSEARRRFGDERIAAVAA
ncbi:ATP-dependent DNA helicase RecG [Thermoleophilia bacterium SCSIO 60948]|nr:ATP-dependent DNA helicase RecG [Thermoleophilia bacterium SCSIO 60948]